MKHGDVFFHTTAGSGGWGPPLERDPERVLDDVRNEKLTIDYAEREYGVVIDSKGLRVNYPATQRKRTGLGSSES